MKRRQLNITESSENSTLNQGAKASNVFEEDEDLVNRLNTNPAKSDNQKLKTMPEVSKKVDKNDDSLKRRSLESKSPNSSVSSVCDSIEVSIYFNNQIALKGLRNLGLNKGDSNKVIYCEKNSVVNTKKKFFINKADVYH